MKKDLDKKLSVCDKLLNEKNSIEISKYCAPILIASTFSGITWVKDENLAPMKLDENTIRSGTVTFISYKKEYFAITCKHVVDELKNKQKEWNEEQAQKYRFKSPLEGFLFITPMDNKVYHFNYEFSIVKQDENGIQLDLAIARVKHSAIERLGCIPIPLTEKNNSALTGIASGYPELNRKVSRKKDSIIFNTRCLNCLAYLQETNSGKILIEGEIEDQADVDVLSGMSGGPIIWSDDTNFGIAGIIYEGSDVKPKAELYQTVNSIMIWGEKITPALFEKWIAELPASNEIEDESDSINSAYKKFFYF